MEDLPKEQPCVCTPGHCIAPWNPWSWENIGGGTAIECPWNPDTQRCDFEEAAAWARDHGLGDHPYLQSVFCHSPESGCFNGQVYGGRSCLTSTTTTMPPTSAPTTTTTTPAATTDKTTTTTLAPAPTTTTTTPTRPRVHHHMAFVPINGGAGRACRGASAHDNNPNYYNVSVLKNIEDCKSQCISTVGCVGIEYSSGRCEVWTREQGIGAFIVLSGYSCLRFASDIPPGQWCARWESIWGNGCDDSKLCTELLQ